MAKVYQFPPVIKYQWKTEIKLRKLYSRLVVDGNQSVQELEAIIGPVASYSDRKKGVDFFIEDRRPDDDARIMPEECLISMTFVKNLNRLTLSYHYCVRSGYGYLISG